MKSILFGILGFIAYLLVVGLIARVMGFNDPERRHPCSKDNVSQFPNYWRRGEK